MLNLTLLSKKPSFNIPLLNTNSKINPKINLLKMNNKTINSRPHLSLVVLPTIMLQNKIRKEQINISVRKREKDQNPKDSISVGKQSRNPKEYVTSKNIKVNVKMSMSMHVAYSKLSMRINLNLSLCACRKSNSNVQKSLH